MLTEFEKFKASEAERYLRGIHGAKMRIKTLSVTIADIYEEMEGIRGVDYSSERVKGGVKGDALTRMIADKDERMQECQRQAHELECRVRRAEYVLNRMPDQRYAALLESRYLQGLSWKDAGAAIGYSDWWCYKWRDDAHIAFYDSMMEADKKLPDAIVQ